MKIQIRAPGMALTVAQRRKLETQLALALARFGQRIDRVIVRLSDAKGVPGYKRCEVEVCIGPRAATLSAEHSDITIFHALEHAASRVARTMRRTLDNEAAERR